MRKVMIKDWSNTGTKRPTWRPFAHRSWLDCHLEVVDSTNQPPPTTSYKVTLTSSPPKITWNPYGNFRILKWRYLPYIRYSTSILGSWNSHWPYLWPCHFVNDRTEHQHCQSGIWRMNTHDMFVSRVTSEWLWTKKTGRRWITRRDLWRPGEMQSKDAAEFSGNDGWSPWSYIPGMGFDYWEPGNFWFAWLNLIENLNRC